MPKQSRVFAQLSMQESSGQSGSIMFLLTLPQIYENSEQTMQLKLYLCKLIKT